MLLWKYNQIYVIPSVRFLTKLHSQIFFLFPNLSYFAEISVLLQHQGVPASYLCTPHTHTEESLGRNPENFIGKHSHPSLSLCLSLYRSACLSIALPVSLLLCLSLYCSAFLSITLPVYLSLCLSIYHSACLSIACSFSLLLCLSLYCFTCFSNALPLPL